MHVVCIWHLVVYLLCICSCVPGCISKQQSSERLFLAPWEYFVVFVSVMTSGEVQSRAAFENRNGVYQRVYSNSHPGLNSSKLK